MAKEQPGIRAAVPKAARYLELTARPEATPAGIMKVLGAIEIDAGLVLGLGAPLAQRFKVAVPGLRGFPAMTGPGFAVPSTQAELWCWLRGADTGEALQSARRVLQTLAPAFRLERCVDGFKYGRGLDLSGYEDGTENPKGRAARDAAILQGVGRNLDGSSFVAIQQWRHDLDRFEVMRAAERDAVMGRRLRDNAEIANAPASAHVKRTAQESFAPEAFVLRRSMPWADACGAGLMFVAFGKSLDAFEAQLRRMTGEDDGIVDALFRVSRPVTGSYYWCPPVAKGRLDLSILRS